MKIATIGDLHAAEWKVWPVTKTGRNSYLAQIDSFIQATATWLQRTCQFGEDDYIILLGDLADAPYKTGAIGVDVLVTLTSALRQLAILTGSKVIVISGNHDAVAKVTSLGQKTVSWVDVVATIPNVEVVAAQPMYNAAGNFTCLPYASPTRVERWLTSGLVPNEKTLVLGHFVPRGAKMDNGLPYADEFSVDITKCIARRFALGHAHTPHAVTTAQGQTVVMPGLPLPYSWTSSHHGAIDVYDNSNDQTWEPNAKLYSLSPTFAGPVTYAELQQLGGSLVNGSFVRLFVPPDNKGLLQTAKAAFPALRLFPVIEPPKVAPPEEKARLEVLTRCLGNTSPEAAAEVLTAYVDYQKDKSASDLKLDILLEVGKQLMGVAPPADLPVKEASNDTTKTAKS